MPLGEHYVWTKNENVLIEGGLKRDGDLSSFQSWDQWQKNSEHVTVRTLLNRKYKMNKSSIDQHPTCY